MTKSAASVKINNEFSIFVNKKKVYVNVPLYKLSSTGITDTIKVFVSMVSHVHKKFLIELDTIVRGEYTHAKLVASIKAQLVGKTLVRLEKLGVAGRKHFAKSAIEVRKLAIKARDEIKIRNAKKKAAGFTHKAVVAVHSHTGSDYVFEEFFKQDPHTGQITQMMEAHRPYADAQYQVITL